MRKYGIAGLRLRRRQVTTVPEPSATPVPDLFRRDFTATAPNTKYVGDITYLVRREALRCIPYSIGRNLEDCS